MGNQYVTASIHPGSDRNPDELGRATLSRALGLAAAGPRAGTAGSSAGSSGRRSGIRCCFKRAH